MPAVFEQSWKGKVQVDAFNHTKWATQSFVSTTGPNSEFNFSPHTMADARSAGGIADRIAAEVTTPRPRAAFFLR